VQYEVVVYAGGQVALCAQLRTNWWHGKPKPKDAERRQAEQIVINALSGFENGLPPGFRNLPVGQRKIANLINSISPKKWLPICRI